MNLVVPALAVGYLFYTGMKSMGERLQKCEISSFKLGKLSIGLQQTTIPVVLNIFNPNNTDVPAEYFRGIISRAGNKVGDFTFDSKGERILLKARQETPLTFNIRITTVGVLTNLVNIFKNLFAARPIETVFTVNGTISIGGFDLPVNFAYDVKTQKVVDSVNGIGRVESQEVLNQEIENYFESASVPGYKDRQQYAVEVQKITDYLQKLTKAFNDVKISVAQNEIRIKYNKGNGIARIKLDPVRKEILLPKLKAIIKAGVHGIGSLSDKEYYNYELSKGQKLFYKWQSQRLGSDYKEQEKELSDFLKEKNWLLEKIDWLLTGNYGSETLFQIKNWYKNIQHTEKRRKQGLRVIAINTLMLLVSKEFYDLNAAKFRSVVKSTLSKAEMEQLNDVIAGMVEKEALENHWILS